jgi:hypothetical protein
MERDFHDFRIYVSSPEARCVTIMKRGAWMMPAPWRLPVRAPAGMTKIPKLWYSVARNAASRPSRKSLNTYRYRVWRAFLRAKQLGLGLLLEPLKTRLSEFQGKVEEVYVQEGKDRSALSAQVRQLVELNQALSQDALSRLFWSQARQSWQHRRDGQVSVWH